MLEAPTPNAEEMGIYEEEKKISPGDGGGFEAYLDAPTPAPVLENDAGHEHGVPRGMLEAPTPTIEEMYEEKKRPPSGDAGFDAYIDESSEDETQLIP